MADRWLRIRPGSEDALAQALAGQVAHATAAEATGLPESEISDLALQLQQHGPVLVLGSSRLESASGTIIRRRETPVPAEWRQKAAPVIGLASLPDRSVRVLLIDESAPGEYLPWNAIERKLVPDNPVVVAFACSREGYGRHAQYVLPVGIYPEVAGDIPPAVDSVAATFRLSSPLVAAPSGVVKPEEFVAAAAGLSIGNTLRERADAIHKSAGGTLFTYADAKSVTLKDVAAGDFWKALNSGGCWIDSLDDKASAARFAAAAAESMPADDAELPLAVIISRELTPASPILSKVYQESNLRLAPDSVALNPSCGLEDGTIAVLETLLGKCRVGVKLDAGVPPGAVQVSASPAVLDLCAAGARAKVVRA
jgi:anaerobic selenocysteine-containing dehydrogenase